MGSEIEETEEMFEKALEIAETHLDKALTTAGEMAPYVAVAMIEASINQAVDMTSPEDVVAMLQDMISQIEGDSGDDDDEDEDEEE